MILGIVIQASVLILGFSLSSDSLDTLSISLTSDSLGQSVVERQSRGPVSRQATVLAPLSSYILDVQFPCQATVLAPVFVKRQSWPPFVSSDSLGAQSSRQATILTLGKFLLLSSDSLVSRWSISFACLFHVLSFVSFH